MLSRLDNLLFSRGLTPSREKAQALILAGAVWSGNQRLDKAGMKVPDDLPLEIRNLGERFVSRAGEKLDYALTHFGVDPAGRVCLDIGASTGGFTHCLLTRRAKTVFAIDSGHGQLDVSLRNDSRVFVLEKTNARFLDLNKLNSVSPLAGDISLCSIDVSFISISKILPALVVAAKTTRDWMVLFKPQFEVGRKWVGKGGVVRDQAAALEALDNFSQSITELGLECVAPPVPSPVAGKKSGNIEYLLHLGWKDTE